MKINNSQIYKQPVLQSMQMDVIQSAEINPQSPMSVLPFDLMVLMFSMLNPKTMAQASATCKAFYRTSKASPLWSCFFQRYFPRIKYLDPVQNFIPIERQFKVLFLYLKEEKKPFIAFEKKIRDRIDLLRGPNGCDGQIEQAKQQFDAFQQAFSEFPPDLQDISYPQLEELSKNHQHLKMLLKKLAGSEFDGTNESIDRNSKLSTAIFFRSFHSYEFDDQATFNLLMENAMGKTEIAKKFIQNNLAARFLNWIPKTVKKWKEKDA